MITHGLNTFGGQVTQGYNESSGGGNLAVSLPRVVVGDWYVRERKGTTIIGPMTYRDANLYAKRMSRIRGSSGLAEVITYLAQRPGDPTAHPRLCVQGIYARGRKFLAGRAAQYHSDNDLLLEAPDYGYKL